jgi:hypothetical protein
MHLLSPSQEDSGNGRMSAFKHLARAPSSAWALPLLAVAACSSAQKAKGQLIISVDSDMSLPQDVDTVRVEVIAGAETQPRLAGDYPIGQEEGEILLPATLTVLAGSDPALPVTVRVIGKKGLTARTLREITTTVPTDRTAWMRMPIQWLCDGSAQAGTNGSITSTCGSGYTCAAGSCVAAQTPVQQLPNFRPENVYGGAMSPAAGACYDTLPCMQGGTIVTPALSSAGSCRAPFTGSPPTNVALQVAGEGICDDTLTACFIPLDNDKDSGWQISESSLVLPKTVCDRVSSGRVSAVLTSTSCASKTPELPTCGPWSSVKTPSHVPEQEAGAPPLVPELVTNFSSADSSADAGALSLCCGLVSDGASLYACSCGADGSVTLLGVMGDTPSPRSAGSLSLKSPTATLGLTVVSGVALWKDRDPVSSASLIGQQKLGASSATTFPVNFDLYDRVPLVADEKNIYALGDPIDGGAPQLIVIDRTTQLAQGYEIGGPGYAQGWASLAQDANAVYLIADAPQANDATLLNSTIVRFDKAKAALAPLNLTQVPSGTETGYIGLAPTGSTLGALLVEPVAPSGQLFYQPWSIDAAGNATALVSPLQASGDPDHHPVLLSASPAATLIANFATTTGSEPIKVASSSVLIASAQLPSARVVADFRDDSPIAGATSADGASLYWLMASGRLYRIQAADWVKP